MKQQPVFGFCLAMVTAMAWGSLPIALKQVLSVMDSQTIVGSRFIAASAALFLLLGFSRKLPSFRRVCANSPWLVVLGVLGLSGNFFLFNSSLNYIEPSVAQIFIHLSSFVMLLCGVVVFKEKLGVHQKIGLLVLMTGLLLFFNDKLSFFLSLNQYFIGVALSITAASVWVAYGMAQKLMLRRFTSQQILLMIYTGCALVFMPFAHFGEIQSLDGFVLVCFIYCCLNTLIGYGAYAEALNRWEVSKVSVVLTLVPLFTILFSHIAHYFSPARFANPELNSVSYIGAFIVVLGAMLSAIGHKLIKSCSPSAAN